MFDLVEAILDECELCRYGVGLIYDTAQDPALKTRIQDAAEDLCQDYDGDYQEVNICHVTPVFV